MRALTRRISSSQTRAGGSSSTRMSFHLDLLPKAHPLQKNLKLGVSGAPRDLPSLNHLSTISIDVGGG